MRNLTPVFGDKPRVRLLEALLALAPYEFTRGEVAREAGLPRASVNRVFPEVEQLGLVQVVEGGARPSYRVNRESEVLRIIQYLDHALGVALEDSESGAPADRFQRSVNDRHT